jgi:hypothetical protein
MSAMAPQVQRKRRERVTKTPVFGGVVDRKPSEIVLDEMVLV